MMEEISLQNKWWITGKVDKNKLGSLKRQDFDSLKAKIKNKKINCLLGPRRAGKTTLMYMLMNHLILNAVNPRNILYFSCDNSKIRINLNNDFDQLFKEFITTISSQDINNIKNKIYIFIDEIHKLDDWSNKIKYWQDLGLNIKFIISGSSSIRILKGSGESLLGRIEFDLILPLTFQEFIGKKFSIDFLDFKKIKKLFDELNLKKQNIILKLNQYMIKGGYPEVFFSKSIDDVFQILRTYKILSITRDLIDLKDIKEPKRLDDLAELLTDFMSCRINYSRFADILKIKVDTVKKYMEYLEECFLIYTSYVYSKSKILSTRKEKKLFFVDHGLRNSLFSKEIDENEKAKIIENIVFMHLFHLKKQELIPKMFYWLDEYRNEVDIVVSIKKQLIPIEVKYKNDIKKQELKGLLKFLERFDVDQGIVITKDLFKEEKFENKKILYLPIWLFLLIL